MVVKIINQIKEKEIVMREFTISTSVLFGEGALDRLSQVMQKRVMIITDSFIAQSDILEKVKSKLGSCTVTVFDEIVPDPPVEVVARGLEKLKEVDAQVIVAVGGGSSIDGAKAIREMAAKMDGLNLHIDECYAIPTTSGTGSEVTKFSVITDTKNGKKTLLVNDSLIPMVAILDPEFTKSVPPGITADTGLDALTHAIEAYVSKDATDFTDALAEKSISLIFYFLPKAYRNGEDTLARERMHNASCLAGMAFNDAGLGINHSIAHAIGAKFNIPHGKSNALLLPHIIEYNAALAKSGYENYTVTARKYQRIARIVGVPASSVPVAIGSLIKRVCDMQKELGIPASFSELGIQEEAVEEAMDEMVKNALADMCTKTNPTPVSAEDVEKIIRKLL
jgi:1-propanol dehydrogenase